MGTLVITVLEVRDITASFIQMKVEYTVASTVRQKNSKTIAYKDNNSFEFPIEREKGHVNILAFKRSMIGLISDKAVGFLQIPVEKLLAKETPAEWYPLHPVPKGYDENVMMEVKDADADDGKKGKKKGQVRLEFQFIENVVEEEKIEGKRCEGEWTEGMSGGLITSSAAWYDNPQFLLTVAKETEITVHLRQDDKKARATFFVLKYDNDIYLGRRITSFTTGDIKKVERDFMSPIVGCNTMITETFSEGTYCIIPTTEKAGSTGKFTVIAATKNLNNIELAPLPADGEKAWKEVKVAGKWEDAGGSDINTLTWYNNPQYLFNIKETCDVGLQLNQEAATLSIGYYVFDLMLNDEDDEDSESEDGEESKAKKIDYSKVKQVTIFKNCIAQTKSCKYIYSCGEVLKDLDPGCYAVIPVTYSANVSGAFELRLFAPPSSEITCVPLTAGWKQTASVLSSWKGERAGGGPGGETYLNNPQFELEVDNEDGEQSEQVVLHLSQCTNAKSEYNSIGMFVFEREDDDDEGPLTVADPDLVVAQSKKFSNLHSVELIFKIKAGEKNKYVVIPSTFKPNCEGDFRLTVLTDAKSVACTRLTDGDVEPQLDETNTSMKEEQREELPPQRAEKEEKEDKKDKKKKEKETKEEREEEKEEEKEEESEKGENEEKEKEDEKVTEENEEKEKSQGEGEKKGEKKKHKHHKKE